ncbi:MAG TPA: hypothetical protein PLW68_00900 [Casimicrobiaceae bacterium]|nr:hypothetical protein [Casimicrobiaceae bacterium]
MMQRRASLAIGCAVALAACVGAGATPVTPARIGELCAEAEGPSHCGRLIEADQLKALPNLAIRDGRTLKVLLYPSGSRDLVDVETLQGGTTWSLWDYWSTANIVVLFTTSDDRMGYAVLQRTTGQLTPLPGEPVLSPDRQRLAIADFCRANCENEVTVWRISRDGVRRELAWKPEEEWSDVTLRWKSDATLTLEFTPKAEGKATVVDRRLTDAGWQQAGPRAP